CAFARVIRGRSVRPAARGSRRRLRNPACSARLNRGKASWLTLGSPALRQPRGGARAPLGLSSSLVAITKSTPLPRHEAIQSAIRTLETERDGLNALAESIGNGLGDVFADAVAMISAAEGRVIVTGMGKSGHVARK